MYHQDGKIVYQNGTTKTIPYGTEVLAPGSDKLNAVRVEMPDSITTIAEEAFWACMELEEVRFSANLKNVGRASFCYCKNIKRIILPYGVETIGHGAFLHCLATEEVSIPNTIKSIGLGSFAGCNNVCIAEGNPRYIMGDGCLVGTQTKTMLWGAGSCTFPKEADTVGDSAFYKQDVLYCKLPDWFRVIKEAAFQHCEDLQYIVLPKEIQRIEKDAFFGCKELKKINLPKDIILEKDCFYGCDSLTIEYEGSSRDWRYRNEYLGSLSIKVLFLGK